MKKSNQRFQHSIGAKFKTEISDVNFLCAPSDMGVRRNLGRSGARFAPTVILNQFKKLNYHLPQKSFASFTVSDQAKERDDFNKAQLESSKKIQDYLNQDQILIHLGGGHDHAFPMLMALDEYKKCKNILILNIDAHCDTRVDDHSHSGTPFRDYDLKGKKNFFLYQMGIHEFANSKDTLSALTRGKMFVDKFSQCFNSDHFEQILKTECNFEINQDTLVFISLDTDALHSSIMSAVSAVNHHGLNLDFVCAIIEWVKTKKLQSVFGIYEYNPLFDNISCSSARALSYLIHQYLKI
jgi:formiminoglutamase